jgi:hypothetical protein
MPVTDAHVAALRAFLVMDRAALVPLTVQLGDQGMDDYLYLTEAALSVLAVRRFSLRFTRSEIIRYVASVRASRISGGPEYDLDPVATEGVLRYYLGQADAPVSPDPKRRVPIVLALLDALVDSELPNDRETEAILTEARALADHWAANGPRP